MTSLPPKSVTLGVFRLEFIGCVVGSGKTETPLFDGKPIPLPACGE